VTKAWFLVAAKKNEPKLPETRGGKTNKKGTEKKE